jgi:hypothetical protein
MDEEKSKDQKEGLRISALIWRASFALQVSDAESSSSEISTSSALSPEKIN